MKILGLDPGTATTGFGLVETDNRDYKSIDYGCIKTPSGLDPGSRLLIIKEDLQTLIDRYQPDLAVVEDIFFAKNVKTAIQVGEARGVILATLAEKGIVTHSLKPVEIKKAIVGYGHATKKQMQEMVSKILHLEKPISSDDAADALALCLTFLQTSGH